MEMDCANYGQMTDVEDQEVKAYNKEENPHVKIMGA